MSVGVATAVVDAELHVRRDGFELAAELRVGRGEVVALLGPNGAGKTTVARVLAGLVALDRGRVVVAGDVVDDPGGGRFVPPEDRPVGVVFQDLLLFPHLSALENVAFGVRSRGASRAGARRAALGWLERVGVADLAARRPAELSGGQAQRVALARALAPGPEVLVLDEPLAALDVEARGAVRRELRAELAGFDGATVLITHDPVDAFALASRVVVLEGGRVTQAGTMHDLQERPRTAYVAELLGTNLLRGTARGTAVTLDGSDAVLTTAAPAEGPVLAVVHPSAVALHPAEPAGSPRNHWRGTVEGIELLGDRARVRVQGPVALVAEVTPAAVVELGLTEGQPVWMAVKATEVRISPA